MFSNVPHVEQKLLIHPEHTSSSSGFTGARVAQSLVFWVILCKSWFVLLPFFIWSFYCLSVVDWRLLITTLVYSSLSIVCLSSIEDFWIPLWHIQAFLLSVCRRMKASDYHFGIFKPLYCLSVVDWRLLITTLVYSSLSIVCL
jgi:hypothetical protein